MTPEGHRQIVEALGTHWPEVGSREVEVGFQVVPTPKPGEDLPFVEIIADQHVSTAFVLNALWRGRMIRKTDVDDGQGPNLRLATWSTPGWAMGTQLTLQDINAPDAPPVEPAPSPRYQ